jgi:hypothetical protein
LLVYTSLQPLRAYRLLRNYEYGFVKNIIPVQKISRDINEAAEWLVRYLKRKGIGTVRLKLKVRGIRGRSPEYWRILKNKLLNAGIRHDPRSRVCGYVEVIDETICIGVVECDK